MSLCVLFINSMVGILLQPIFISNHIIQFKRITILFINDTSLKLEKKYIKNNQAKKSINNRY